MRRKRREEEYDDYEEDDYDDYEGENDETTNTNEPTEDETTFKQRNDPAPVLENLRLELMNAYKTKILTTDKNGVEREKTVIKFKKGTHPRMNKQGIDEFINYLRFLINNHTVMGNLVQREDYNNRMRYISDDITCHLSIRQEDWGININDLDIFIAQTQNFVDLFLTRTLFNEERKGYGGFTESRTFTTRPRERRPGLMEKLGRRIGFRG